MTKGEGTLRISDLLALQEREHRDAWIWAWRQLEKTADDTKSEVLLRAFRDDAAALRRADPDAPAAAWLRRTARNVELEQARARPKVVTHVRDDRRSVGIADVDTSPMTDKQATAVELLARGRNVTEIARDLGLSRKAVRERLERGLRRTRRQRAGRMRKRRSVDGRCRTKKERVAVALYRRGFSYREIGDRLKITREAARARIRRVRAWARKTKTK